MDAGADIRIGGTVGTGATGATGPTGPTGPVTDYFPYLQIGGEDGATGPNDFSYFDMSGFLTFTGDARPWRDQLSDSLNLQRSGPGVSTDITESTVDFAYNATYNATFSLADALFCNIQLNHDKDLSVNLYPHIHWIQAKDYAPNLLLEYRWQVLGGIIQTTWTKLACNVPEYTYTPGTSLHQMSHPSASISVPVGSNISDIVQFRIYRDTGNASSVFAGSDPYNTGGNATVSVLAFDVHFQINSIGSTERNVK